MKHRVKERIAEKVPEQPVQDVCNHYWIIEDANGPTSYGACKYCGEKKEFYNSFPDFNPLRRSSNPLTLPVLPEVKVDKESKS